MKQFCIVLFLGMALAQVGFAADLSKQAGNFKLTKGAWYFEVQLTAPRCGQLGWGRHDQANDSGGGLGTGDDSNLHDDEVASRFRRPNQCGRHAPTQSHGTTWDGCERPSACGLRGHR